MKLSDVVQHALAIKDALEMERRPWRPEEHTILVTYEEWYDLLQDTSEINVDPGWINNPIVLGGVHIVPIAEKFHPQPLRPVVCRHEQQALL